MDVDLKPSKCFYKESVGVSLKLLLDMNSASGVNFTSAQSVDKLNAFTTDNILNAVWAVIQNTCLL